MRAPVGRSAHGRTGYGRAVGVSSAFGTFGELLQGVDEEGVEFLVTLPIARWTTATFVVAPDVLGIQVRPWHKFKALRLSRAVASAAGYTGGGWLRIDNDMPEGKGLASSSADLVATARATGNALGLHLSPSAIEDQLRPIEPSDGVMYDGVTAFDHRRVALRRRLGWLPPLTVVALDEGGVVDTVAFNMVKKPYEPRQRREFSRLLDALIAAVDRRDLAEVGRITTRSAELNERLLPKRTFAAMRAAVVRLGALGVVVTHSGPMVGLLVADEDPAYERVCAAARKVCLEMAGNVSVYRSLSAGSERTRDAR